MKLHGLAFAFCLVSACVFSAEEKVPHMFVPDGQVLGHALRVHVADTNLAESMRPELRLVAVSAAGRTNFTKVKPWGPWLVAGDQSWTEKVAGSTESCHGTLLLFDLNEFEVGSWKSTTRVLPVLTWRSGSAGKEVQGPVLVGPWIYLGRQTYAAGWTAIIIGVLLVLITALMCLKKERDKGTRGLLVGEENYYSLWRTQLAVWTVAVAFMVCHFGLIQFDVPRIPESLVALMGLSVATGSLSAIAGKQQPEGRARKEGPAHTPKWTDLISSRDPKRPESGVLSVTKAQMLFWTGIIVVLFVVKSFLAGELWDVPWELVALTGVSQAGYVGDKALSRRNGTGGGGGGGQVEGGGNAPGGGRAAGGEPEKPSTKDEL